jgi:hypothetical protein
MDLEQFRRSLDESIGTSLEDFEEDEVAIEGALQQLEEAIQDDGPLRGRHGGSKPRRKANLMRSRARGHTIMYEDYFANNPKYSEEAFWRRYRMRRSLFFVPHECCL